MKRLKNKKRVIKTTCTEHRYEFDYADSEKSVYVCSCGDQLIEYEDAGTGA